MFDQLKTLLAENPLIMGGASMALIGWGLVQAKALPLKLLRMLKDQFSTTVTIYSEDSVFRLVDLWLARHPSAKHSRRFGVAHYHNRKTDEEDYDLTPGAGLHLLRDGWRCYLVHRNVEEDKGGGEEGGFYNRRRKQTISITTLGRSITPAMNLLNSIKTVQEDTETVPVYLWAGHDYSLIERRPKRDLSTVYLNEAVKSGVLDDLTRFFSRRQWYADRGIPYRRGISLEGPPGTGKTTLIFALASHYAKPIYIVNPATIENDNQLQRAINQAGSNFVVIEDIDAIKAAGERSASQGKPAPRRRRVVTEESHYEDEFGMGPMTFSAGEASKSGITLSGLLNAIDGIGARDGRVLFITSNHADTLDAALMRPGRIDRRLLLDHITRTEVEQMHAKFFPGVDSQLFVSSLESELPLPAAEVQNRLLAIAEDGDRAV